MNVTASIPEGLSLRAGEELQLQALVQADGSFLVTHVLHRESPSMETSKPPMTLSEWMRKWGGKFKLPEGKSIDDIRQAAVSEKDGV